MIGTIAGHTALPGICPNLLRSGFPKLPQGLVVTWLPSATQNPIPVLPNVDIVLVTQKDE
jgi:hypothetical protein